MAYYALLYEAGDDFIEPLLYRCVFGRIENAQHRTAHRPRALDFEEMDEILDLTAFCQRYGAALQWLCHDSISGRATPGTSLRTGSQFRADS